MKLKIKPFNSKVRSLYDNHSHFHSGDAGLDLFVVDNQLIKGKSSSSIHMQIACENLDNKAYYLFPRSSISKTPLRLANSIGLIDGGYRGEIVAMVDNIYDEDYEVKEGERYFQLVAVDSSPIEFEIVEELSISSRGEGGFGSTGR